MRTRSSAPPPHYAHRKLNALQRSLFYAPFQEREDIDVVHPYCSSTDAPNILLFRDFLSEDEHGDILSFLHGNEDAFERSCCDTFSVDLEQRDSRDLLYPQFRESPCLLKLFRLLGISARDIETPQVVKYEEGGHFSVHHDTSPITDDDGTTREPSQYSDEYVDMIHDVSTFRTVSGILYLDTTQDGHTHFPKLNFKQQPLKRFLLLWPNVKPDGSVETATVHHGSRVSSTKRIINVWVNTLDERTL